VISRGSLAMLTATRCASSLVRRLFTARRDGSSSQYTYASFCPLASGDGEAFVELLDRPGRPTLCDGAHRGRG
jgi:hypothetical protein